MKRTCEAGTSVSPLHRQVGVAENSPSHWRKLEHQGALTAVPSGAAAAPAAARGEIAKLVRLLSKKPLGKVMLTEAVECAVRKK